MHQNAMFLGPRLSISEFKRRQACNPTQPIFAALKVKIISKRIFQLEDTLRKHTSTMIRISKYRKYNKYNGAMIRGASTGDLHNAGHRCTSDYLVLDPWWAGVCPDKTISMHLVPDRSCESYQYNPHNIHQSIPTPQRLSFRVTISKCNHSQPLKRPPSSMFLPATPSLLIVEDTLSRIECHIQTAQGIRDKQRRQIRTPTGHQYFQYLAYLYPLHWYNITIQLHSTWRNWLSTQYVGHTAGR